MLEVKNVSLREDSQPLFCDLSFTVEDRHTLCLFGGQNTGKTHLLRAIMGLEPVVEGHISIDGELLNPTSAKEFRKHMAYVPQNIHLIVDTVDELVKLPFSLEVNKGKVFSRDKLMIEWNLLGLPDSYLMKKVDELTVTDLQLVVLSIAAITGKSIILADEPSSNFSDDGEQLVANYLTHLAQEGRTVLATSKSEHFASLLERQVEI